MTRRWTAAHRLLAALVAVGLAFWALTQGPPRQRVSIICSSGATLCSVIASQLQAQSAVGAVTVVSLGAQDAASALHTLSAPDLASALAAARTHFTSLPWIQRFSDSLRGVAHRSILVGVDESLTTLDASSVGSMFRTDAVVLDVIDERATGGPQTQSRMGINADPLIAGRAANESRGRIRLDFAGFTSGPARVDCSLDGGAAVVRADVPPRTAGSQAATIPWQRAVGPGWQGRGAVPFGFHHLSCKATAITGESLEASEYVRAVSPQVLVVVGAQGRELEKQATQWQQVFESSRATTGEDGAATIYANNVYGEAEFRSNSAVLTDVRSEPLLFVADGVSKDFWQHFCGDLRAATSRGVHLLIVGAPAQTTAQMARCDWLPAFGVVDQNSGQEWVTTTDRRLLFVKDGSPFGRVTLLSPRQRSCGDDCQEVARGDSLQDEIQAEVVKVLRSSLSDQLSGGAGKLALDALAVPADGSDTEARLRAASLASKADRILADRFASRSVARLGDVVVLFAYDLPQFDIDASSWLALRRSGAAIVLVLLRHPLSATFAPSAATTSPFEAWFAAAEKATAAKLASEIAHLPLTQPEYDRSLGLVTVDLQSTTRTLSRAEVLQRVQGALPVSTGDPTKTAGVVAEVAKQIVTWSTARFGLRPAVIQGDFAGRLGVADPEDSSGVWRFPRARQSPLSASYAHWAPPETSTLEQRPVFQGSVVGRANVFVSARMPTGALAARLRTFTARAAELRKVSTQMTIVEVTRSSDGVRIVTALGGQPDSSPSESVAISACSNGFRGDCARGASERATMVALDTTERIAEYLLRAASIGQVCGQRTSCVAAIGDSDVQRVQLSRHNDTEPEQARAAALQGAQRLADAAGGLVGPPVVLVAPADARSWSNGTAAVVILMTGTWLSVVVQRLRRRSAADRHERGRRSQERAVVSAVSPSGRASVDEFGLAGASKPLEVGDKLSYLSEVTILAWSHYLTTTPRVVPRETLRQPTLICRIDLANDDASIDSAKTDVAARAAVILMASAIASGKSAFVVIGDVTLGPITAASSFKVVHKGVVSLSSGGPPPSALPVHTGPLQGDELLLSDFLAEPAFARNDAFLRTQIPRAAVVLVHTADWAAGGFVRSRRGLFDRRALSSADEERQIATHVADSKSVLSRWRAATAIVGSTMTDREIAAQCIAAGVLQEVASEEA